MKKLIFFALFLSAGVWTYFWYVRGENILDSRAVASALPAYAAGAREPAKGTDGTLTLWRQAMPLPEPRLGASAAALNGKIYVVGGIDPYGRTTYTTFVFDISKNEWSAAAPLPHAVKSAAVASDGSKLYVFGGLEGFSQTPIDETYVYYPETDSWKKLTDLPDPLGAAAVVYLPDGFHVIGGLGLGKSAQSHFVYSPDKNAWSTAEAITSGRDHLAAAVLDSRILAIGGRAGSLVYNMDNLEIFHPESLQWEQGAHLPAKRSSAGAAVVGGTLYVFGGEAASLAYSEVFSFDAKADRWKIINHIPTPRHGFAWAVADGRIFVIGGGRRTGFSVSDLVEVFTP
jgi:N-acetylneuraminic acid mutarotase